MTASRPLVGGHPTRVGRYLMHSTGSKVRKNSGLGGGGVRRSCSDEDGPAAAPVPLEDRADGVVEEVGRRDGRLFSAGPLRLHVSKGCGLEIGLPDLVGGSNEEGGDGPKIAEKVQLDQVLR